MISIVLHVAETARGIMLVSFCLMTLLCYIGERPNGDVMMRGIPLITSLIRYTYIGKMVKKKKKIKKYVIRYISGE